MEPNIEVALGIEGSLDISESTNVSHGLGKIVSQGRNLIIEGPRHCARLLPRFLLHARNFGVPMLGHGMQIFARPPHGVSSTLMARADRFTLAGDGFHGNFRPRPGWCCRKKTALQF
jgi:hypothetical protein